MLMNVLAFANVVLKQTMHHNGKRFLWRKISSQKQIFRHKATFVATFLIATSRHKYLPHKYSSDDFSFPTNGHTH
jgi:hypothetical protein